MAAGRACRQKVPAAVTFLTILSCSCLALLTPHTAPAATISAKSVNVTLSSANFGLSAQQPHPSWTGASTLDGGEASGQDLNLTEGLTTITINDLLFWTYYDTKSNRNVTATYTMLNRTLATSGVSSATSSITISNIQTSNVIYTPNNKTYSGYADMTLDLSNATRSGSYTTTGYTVQITVTIK